MVEFGSCESDRSFKLKGITDGLSYFTLNFYGIDYTDMPFLLLSRECRKEKELMGKYGDRCAVGMAAMDDETAEPRL